MRSTKLVMNRLPLVPQFLCHRASNLLGVDEQPALVRLSQCLYDRPQQRLNMFRRLYEAGVIDRLHGCNGIDRRNFGLITADLLNHDIAGKHGADLVL